MEDDKDLELDDINIAESDTLLDDIEGQRVATSLPDRSTTFLDGLRGLAALCVFMQHYLGFYNADKHEVDHGFGENGYYYFASLHFLRLLFSGGNAAVAIFFVLSGYVLSRSSLRLLRDGQNCNPHLISAVVRRPIRLYLPPLATTLIFAMLMHAPFGLLASMPWPEPQPTMAAELKNWLVDFLKFFNPIRTHGINQLWFRYGIVVWTIPIELKGSMLVYLLVFMLSRLPRGSRRTRNFIILPIIAVLLLFLHQWAMSLFVAGIALSVCDLYHLDDTLWISPLGQSVVYHILGVSGWYLLCQPAHPQDVSRSLNTPGWHFLTSVIPQSYYKDEYWRFWQSIGAFMFVFSIRQIDWLQQFFLGPPLKYLGKVSFLLYLTHPMVIFTCGETLQRILGQLDNKEGEQGRWYDSKLWIPDWGPVGFSTRFLVTLVVMLPLCLAFAHLGTVALDRPSVQFGRWTVRKIGLR